MDTTTTTETTKKNGTSPAAAAAIAETAPTAGVARREEDVLLDAIDKGHNYRIRFNETEDLELAQSIRRHRVLQRIVLRPKPKGRFELVAGERRVRASRMKSADLDKVGPAPTSIPALVMELSDAQVREIQAVENGQRADPHPLEEADLYRDMHDKDKKSVEAIATTIKKSPSYVRAKMKLGALAKGPRKAFEDGKLVESIALLIARIPKVELQEQACKEVLGEGDFETYNDTGLIVAELDVEDDKGRVSNEIQALSVRQAQALIQKRYMLRLDLARFDTADAQLVKEAGACTGCEHRTGNQRELFNEVRSADVCTNPPCFEKKTNAEYDRKAAAAIRAGQKILSGAENKKTFGDGTSVSYGSEFALLDDALPYPQSGWTTKKTFKALLGTKLPQVYLGQDGNGAARELVKKSDAIAKAEKEGLLKRPKPTSGSASRSSSGNSDVDDYRAQQKRAQADRAKKEGGIRIALGKVAAAAGAEPIKGKLFAWWKFLAGLVVELAGDTELGYVTHQLDLEVKGAASSRLAANGKALETWMAGKDRSVEDLRGLVVEILAAPRYNNDKALKACAEYFHVDLKKCQTEAAAAIKAKAAGKKATPPKTRKKGGK